VTTGYRPADEPPEVALLLPEPGDGGLPALKPLEPFGLVELAELLEPAELPELGPPVSGVLVPAWWVAPGSRNAITPVAANPATPATAVRDRTIDWPRSLAATALAILLWFMATSSAGLIDETAVFIWNN
jgi:hypothetical protein